MNEKDILELQKKAEKFHNGEYFIDSLRIGNGNSFVASHFLSKFDKALNDFLLSKSRNDFLSEQLYRLITEANICEAIRDKTIESELEHFKQKYKKLESQLKDERSNVETLKNKKIRLEAKLEIYEKDIPKDTLEGDVL